MNSKYTLYVLDTETTGNTPEDRLTQIAYKKVGSDEIICEYFKPPRELSIESMEVTHITNELLVDKPAFEGSALWKKTKEIFEDPNNVLIAHNAPFDINILKNENINVANWIDTMKLARALDTNDELPAARLQYLRYYFNLPIKLPDGMLPHDAAADVIVCESLFDKLKKDLETQSEKTGDDLVEEMIEISKRPRMIRVFTFGKYKGEKVEVIAMKDAGYLEWLLAQKKQNPAGETDWIFTLEIHLKKQTSLF